MTLFRIAEVEKVYRDSSGEPVRGFLLSGQELEIAAGVTALLGQSGVGKSTLLGLLGGLDVPSSGEILFRETPLPPVESAQLRLHRSAHVSVVFQSLNLVTHLSALENAALPLLIRRVPYKEAIARARARLEEVGLKADQMDRLPAHLSGGQQQRVAVARAFTAESQVILADEPTGSLDPQTAQGVMQVFRDLVDRTGRPVILVTHNEELARQYADRIVRLTPDGGYEDVPVDHPPRRHKPPRPIQAAAPPVLPPRMGLVNRCWYAVSDLKHRRTITAITMLAVLISAVYTLTVGFCGERMHFVQRQALSEALSTRVVALTPETSDLEKRFTDARAATMLAWAEVKLGFPCVEFNVQAGLEGVGKGELLPLCGTVPEDPLTAPGRLISGSGVSGRDAREVVLSQRLLARLGGTLKGGAEPRTLTLELQRKLAGRSEVQRIPLTIVGVLRHENQEKVYVPVDLAARLNLWREGQLSALDEQGIGQTLTFPAAVAWSGPEQAQRIAEDLDSYKLTSEKQGTVRVITMEGPIWATADAKGETVPGALGRLGGVRLHTSYHARLMGRSIVALPKDDPRWKSVADPHRGDFGWVGTRGERPEGARGYALDRSLSGVDDLLTTPATLRWLLFDPAKKSFRRATLVQTTDPSAALALQGEWPGSVQADVDEGWCWLRRSGSRTRAIPAELLEEVGKSKPAGSSSSSSGLEWIEEGKVSVALGRKRTFTKARVTLLVVPDAVFARLARQAGVTRKQPDACLWMAKEEDSTPDTIRFEKEDDKEDLPVAASLTSTREAILATPAIAKRLGADTKRGDLVGWGSWSFLLSIQEQLAVHGCQVERSRSHLASKFVALVAATPSAVRKVVPSDAGKLTALKVVPARLKAGELDRTVEVASVADWPGEELELSTGSVSLHPSLAARGLALTVRDHTLTGLRGVARANLPANLVLVGKDVFRELAFHEDEPGRMPHSVTAQTDLFCSDALAYRSALRRLERAEVKARPLTAVSTRPLVRYRIVDRQEKEGRIKMDVVNLLRSLKPGFEEAYPLLTVSAQTGADEPVTVQLTATEPGDPQRFATDLEEGTWIKDGSPLQVVLPLNLAERLGQGVGGAIDVRFARSEPSAERPRRDPPGAKAAQRPVGRAQGRGANDLASGENITLRLAVVGLVQGREVYVLARLARDVQLWRNHELEYNESKQTFASLLEISRAAGSPRYTFFARDEDTVEQLVKRLRRLGYHTEDHLEQQKDVRRLGRVLVAVVVFFVSGCVLIAAITVWLTTALNIQAKVWEIGILRSLGVPARDVLGIFLLQGFLLGLSAFVLALGIFALGEGAFRRVVAQALVIREPAFLEGSPFDVNLLWLPALVALVALGCSLLGVLLPSLRACRLIPAEALRRRD
jgi:ABC-type lipoprotein export system ATPase subunit